ncbi:hypothetical protein BKK79_33160 [Cupriavidus sp. USMAA2-4]|uniref:Cyd operon protein YbgE n=1 Tax=Cupriavidus malaysiensis TaxID=367825 RepID=A0ABM6FCG8_9BURK|nr:MULTISPECIES: cyd operon YbgE family protein [Cupriavidus]AOY96421.1 hypothetical protein BKK79_33160 [Cupriavidus sp. USMAA2-4]AOZ09457.1 hypothetical protein BKK80_27250 [Cupriavidus malaysiensis]
MNSDGREHHDGEQSPAGQARLHLACLGAALLLMVGATVYPQAMSNAAGQADHGIAALMFWAMSAGFVRGVGFLPRFWLWRWLFSGWACALALALAVALRLAG